MVKLRTIENDPASYVVRYKGEYYVWYKTNAADKAQLIDRNGDKYSGTPSVDKLEVIKPLYHQEYNNSLYFKTKIGVFSALTGKKITLPAILALFE